MTLIEGLFLSFFLVKKGLFLFPIINNQRDVIPTSYLTVWFSSFNYKSFFFLFFFFLTEGPRPGPRHPSKPTAATSFPPQEVAGWARVARHRGISEGEVRTRGP